MRNLFLACILFSTNINAENLERREKLEQRYIQYNKIISENPPDRIYRFVVLTMMDKELNLPREAVSSCVFDNFKQLVFIIAKNDFHNIEENTLTKYQPWINKAHKLSNENIDKFIKYVVMGAKLVEKYKSIDNEEDL